MPVAAGIVGDLDRPAIGASAHMPAEHSRAAGFDRAYHFELAKAQMAGVGGAVGCARGAEDVRDLERRSRQDARRSGGGGGRPGLGFAGFAFGGWLWISGLGLRQLWQAVERACDALDELGRDGRVDGRRLQLLMSQHHLDHANIDAVLEQVRGEGMAQHVRMHPPLDLGPLARVATNPAELAHAQMLGRHQATLKEKVLRPRLGIPFAQKRQHVRRQLGQSRAPALGIFDPQRHRRGIDVAHLELDQLRSAQARAVGDRHRAPVACARSCRDQSSDLFTREDDAQLARHVFGERDHPHRVGAPKRAQVEKPQRRQDLIDIGDIMPSLDEVQAKASHVFVIKRVRRGVEMLGEHRHCADIMLLRRRRETAQDHVLDHPSSKRRHRPCGGVCVGAAGGIGVGGHEDRSHHGHDPDHPGRPSRSRRPHAPLS